MSLMEKEYALEKAENQYYLNIINEQTKNEIIKFIKSLPSAQPDVPDINVGDMISRQAAIDDLHGKDPSQSDNIMLMIGDDGIATLYDDTHDITIHCESKEEQDEAKRLLKNVPQWIPCSEKLPDKINDYLCSYNGCAVVDICEYDPNRNEWGFFYDGGWTVVSNVIAWMPLPKPYTERKDE